MRTSKPKPLSYDKPRRYLIIGNIGSGKTVLNLYIAEKLYQNMPNAVLFSLFTNEATQESAYMCAEYSTIFLIPDSYELKIPEKIDAVAMSIKTPINELMEKAIKEKRVVVVLNSLFTTPDENNEYFKFLQRFVTFLKTMRLSMNQMDANVIISIQDAFSLLSRFNLNRKAKIKPLIAELVLVSRHAGASFIIDVQRYMDLFHAVRMHLEVICIKKSTYDYLPPFVRGISQVEPKLLRIIQNLKVDEYLCYFRHDEPDKAYGFRNPLPTFYYPKTTDNFFELSGIRVKRREGVKEPDLNVE